MLCKKSLIKGSKPAKRVLAFQLRANGSCGVMPVPQQATQKKAGKSLWGKVDFGDASILKLINSIQYRPTTWGPCTSSPSLTKPSSLLFVPAYCLIFIHLSPLTKAPAPLLSLTPYRRVLRDGQPDVASRASHGI